MDIAVIIASIRRSEEIGQLLRHLARQSKPPAEIVLSVEQPSDLPPTLDPNLKIVMGPKGLTGQRNRGLEQVLGTHEIIVFFDDDFIPSNDALENISKLFEQNEDITAATGQVIRDGVTTGGISYREALSILDRHKNDLKITNIDTHGLYGCNMAFRSMAIGDIRFDEKLPLYAWQEDVDFGEQVSRKGGRVVKTNAFFGVHRGVNKGRTPGIAFGYSQVVNPVYLIRKGTMRPMQGTELMAKNLIANHIKVLRPEPFIDRAGRIRGNWIGLLHLATGKLDPTEILKL